MKMIDVMTSQTCDDDPKLAANSPPLSKTRQQDDSKTRQRRWAATNCRLAEQVEAEKVLLSSDITRLRNQGDWKAGGGGGGEEDTSYGRCSSQDFTVKSRGGGEEDTSYGRCSSQDFTKLRGNKLGCEELYWASVSDEDTVNAVGVASVEDFHTMDRNATGGGPRCPRVSCTPPSPPGEKTLDASPMETDIAEFFPDARTVTARLEVSMKKQGLSPRQRLLYRYQMEEMLTMRENNDDDEDISGDMPDLSADMPDISADMPDISADMPADRSAPMSSSSSVPDQPISSGAGLESESGFAESSSGSPYSWNNSSGSVCGGPDYSPDESSGRGSLSGGLVRDCHICGYAPCSRDDYDAHMKRTHFTHKCHLCIYWSRSPGRLSRHMKTFHGEPNAADSPANRKPKNPRKYACKQCEFFTYVQEEIWNHTRVHVPASKLLSCPHCPFVCAFKHHMQYHMNNHLGHKPYRCTECNYRCNNKSMLNSHKKSHSNDYPYRCAVCNYAAKYRHALNIHLRKKRHFADGEAVLEDGGTARYVRSRSRGVGGGGLASSRNPLASEARRISEGHDLAWQQESQQDSGTIDYDIIKQEPDTVDHSVNNTPYLHAVQQNAVYTLPDGGVQPSLLSISDLSNVKLMRYSPVVYAPRTTPTTVAARNGDVASHGRYNNPARGNNSTIPSISVFSTTSGDQEHASLYETSHQMVRISPCRRFPPRGTSYRTVDLDQDLPHNGLAMSGHHPIDAVRDFPSEFSTKERPLDLTSKPRRNTNPDIPGHRSSWGSVTEKVPRSCRYECQHCGIIFPERVLYSMHMEYHGPTGTTTADPFQCNLCGQRTKDRREFFNHINQVAHKSSAI